MVMPAPPASSGILAEVIPRLAAFAMIFRMVFFGSARFLSALSNSGCMSASTMRFAALMIICCSVVKEKSIVVLLLGYRELRELRPCFQAGLSGHAARISDAEAGCGG